MNDLQRKQLEDKFSDSALELWMDEYAGLQGQEILAQYEAARVSMPKDLDKSCQAAIMARQKESEKGTLLRRTAGRAAKAAAVTLVCLFLLGNLVMSVEALRVPFLNFCIQTRRTVSHLTFQKDAESNSENSGIGLLIGGPSGFTLTQKYHNHDDYDLIYQDSDLLLLYTNEEGKYFSIQTFPAIGMLSIDTEDAECSDFLLNGMDAMYISEPRDGTLRTIWIDAQRQRLYDITTNGMTEEEFQQEVYSLSGMFMVAELYE